MIDQDKVYRLLQRYQRLYDQQYNYAIEWQELADYILPRKNSILVQRVPGWKRTQRLFDSTAPDSADKLAASVHSTLTPSFMKWFHLQMEDQELNQNYEVKVWLDKVTTLIMNALNKSNYNSEGHETFIDLIVFGTGCLYEDEKSGGWWGGLQFTSIPPGKYCVSEGPDGRVDTLYRSFPLPLHAIQQQWGEDNLPKELAQVDKPDELYEIIHVVYPAGDNNVREFRWSSCYILYKFRYVLAEGGYYNFPFLVPRWTKNSDEMYGRGPSHTALPDIRTLNKLTEMELRALAKVVDPPLGVVSGDVIGPARMIPGGVTTTRSKDAIFPINTGYNYQIANLKAEELKKSIKEMYYSDQLQLQTGPQMTATEVNVRFELMQRILGPVLGRIEAEFTKPLLQRTFYLMHKAGLFNPIPDAITNHEGPALLKIQYMGSLARAQRSSDISALQQFEQLITPFIQVNEDVKDVIDFDAITRHTAEILDVPAKVIRDEKQVKQIRDEKQKMQEAQQQMEQMQQGAEAAKSAAPLLRVAGERPKPGSLLSKVA